MDRSQKADLVAELKSVFTETSVVVVTRNLGLTVAQSTNLRNRMRDAGAAYKVTKNTLALIALEGTRYAPLSELLTGPTALATSTGFLTQYLNGGSMRQSVSLNCRSRDSRRR